MATPRTIALFDASPQAGTGPTPAGALLADLADALPAYDRISARALGDEGGQPPRMIWLEEEGELPPAGADALVIGCALDGDGARRAADELGRLAKGRSVDAGCLVFALATCTAHGAAGTDGLRRLSDACGELALAWCGGLVAAGSLTIPGSAGKPRMGRARRSRSEAVDQLIGAVRAGLPVMEAARLFGWDGEAARRGLIVSRCPLPRALYRMAHGPLR